MVVAWLVGDPRSVAARTLPSGRSAARQLHTGYKYIFAEHFSCCNNHKCVPDMWMMGRWSKKLIEGCLIGSTLLFKVKEYAMKYEETFELLMV